MSDLPLRASDAGPDDSSTPPDWCDWLYEADEYNKLARHSVKGPQRLQWTRKLIEAAQESLALQEAEEKRLKEIKEFWR